MPHPTAVTRTVGGWSGTATSVACMHRITTVRSTAVRLALVLGAAASLALTGCVVMPPDPGVDMPCGAVTVTPLMECSQVPSVEIVAVVVSQSQAVPDFDSTRYLQTDPAALQELEDILGNQIPPGGIHETSDCTGQRTTVLEVDSTNVDDFTVTVDSCAEATIAGEIDALASAWLASDTLPPAP